MCSFSLEARQCPDVVVADLDTKNFSNRQTVHVNEVCECVFALEQKKILLLEVIWMWIMLALCCWVYVSSVPFQEIIMLLKINYWCLLIQLEIGIKPF